MATPIHCALCKGDLHKDNVSNNNTSSDKSRISELETTKSSACSCKIKGMPTTGATDISNTTSTTDTVAFLSSEDNELVSDTIASEDVAINCQVNRKMVNTDSCFPDNGMKTIHLSQMGTNQPAQSTSLPGNGVKISGHVSELKKLFDNIPVMRMSVPSSSSAQYKISKFTQTESSFCFPELTRKSADVEHEVTLCREWKLFRPAQKVELVDKSVQMEATSCSDNMIEKESNWKSTSESEKISNCKLTPSPQGSTSSKSSGNSYVSAVCNPEKIILKGSALSSLKHNDESARCAIKNSEIVEESCQRPSMKKFSPSLSHQLERQPQTIKQFAVSSAPNVYKFETSLSNIHKNKMGLNYKDDEIQQKTPPYVDAPQSLPNLHFRTKFKDTQSSNLQVVCSKTIAKNKKESGELIEQNTKPEYFVTKTLPKYNVTDINTSSKDNPPSISKKIETHSSRLDASSVIMYDHVQSTSDMIIKWSKVINDHQEEARMVTKSSPGKWWHEASDQQRRVLTGETVSRHRNMARDPVSTPQTSEGNNLINGQVNMSQKQTQKATPTLICSQTARNNGTCMSEGQRDAAQIVKRQSSIQSSREIGSLALDNFSGDKSFKTVACPKGSLSPRERTLISSLAKGRLLHPYKSPSAATVGQIHNILRVINRSGLPKPFILSEINQHLSLTEQDCVRPKTRGHERRIKKPKSSLAQSPAKLKDLHNNGKSARYQTWNPRVSYTSSYLDPGINDFAPLEKSANIRPSILKAKVKEKLKIMSRLLKPTSAWPDQKISTLMRDNIITPLKKRINSFTLKGKSVHPRLPSGELDENGDSSGTSSSGSSSHMQNSSFSGEKEQSPPLELKGPEHPNEMKSPKSQPYCRKDNDRSLFSPATAEEELSAPTFECNYQPYKPPRKKKLSSRLSSRNGHHGMTPDNLTLSIPSITSPRGLTDTCGLGYAGGYYADRPSSSLASKAQCYTPYSHGARPSANKGIGQDSLSSFTSVSPSRHRVDQWVMNHSRIDESKHFLFEDVK